MYDEWFKSGSDQEFMDYWDLTSEEMAQINGKTAQNKD